MHGNLRFAASSAAVITEYTLYRVRICMYIHISYTYGPLIAIR